MGGEAGSLAKNVGNFARFRISDRRIRRFAVSITQVAAHHQPGEALDGSSKQQKQGEKVGAIE